MAIRGALIVGTHEERRSINSRERKSRERVGLGRKIGGVEGRKIGRVERGFGREIR